MNFWTNPAQELLLKTALLPGDAAAEAFKKWLALADRGLGDPFRNNFVIYLRHRYNLRQRRGLAAFIMKKGLHNFFSKA